jgi:hypothetical protein
MAQTKTRTQKKSSSSRGSSRKGSTRKASSRSKSASGTKSGSSRSRSAPSRSKSSGTNRKSASRKSPSGTSSRQQRTTANSGGVMEKVKGPATLAGVTLLGVAGGIAAVRNGGKRRSGLASGLGKAFSKPGISMPSMNGLDLGKRLQGIDLPKSEGSTIGWVEEKARSLGDAGYRLADLTAEARRLQKGGDSE